MSEEEIVQEQTGPECKISYISERPEKFCRELEKKRKEWRYEMFGSFWVTMSTMWPTFHQIIEYCPSRTVEEEVELADTQIGIKLVEDDKHDEEDFNKEVDEIIEATEEE